MGRLYRIRRRRRFHQGPPPPTGPRCPCRRWLLPRVHRIREARICGEHTPPEARAAAVQAPAGHVLTLSKLVRDPARLATGGCCLSSTRWPRTVMPSPSPISRMLNAQRKKKLRFPRICLIHMVQFPLFVLIFCLHARAVVRMCLRGSHSLIGNEVPSDSAAVHSKGRAQQI